MHSMEFPLDPPEHEDDFELIKEDLEVAIEMVADESANDPEDHNLYMILGLLTDIKKRFNKYSYLST